MYDNDNLVKVKSYNFALRIIKLYKHLCNDKKEFVLSKQILRCDTSIGANVEEAIGAISKKDFLNKIYIAHKESRETSYWIKLLRDSDYINRKSSESLLIDCDELIKITGKIISSTNRNLKENS
jgi:four helix bundle protein